jgi:hypothetical protein
MSRDEPRIRFVAPAAEGLVGGVRAASGVTVPGHRTSILEYAG